MDFREVLKQVPGARLDLVQAFLRSEVKEQKPKRWWFQIFLIFTPKIGEDEPILTSIFFLKWVGKKPPTRNRPNFGLWLRGVFWIYRIFFWRPHLFIAALLAQWPRGLKLLDKPKRKPMVLPRQGWKKSYGVRFSDSMERWSLAIGFLRVPGCPRGGANWGTLRIPFGKIGEPQGTSGKIRITTPR